MAREFLARDFRPTITERTGTDEAENPRELLETLIDTAEAAEAA